MGEIVSTHQDSDRDAKKKESTFKPTFFVGMVFYLIVIIIVGFWPTYFSPFFLAKKLAIQKALSKIHSYSTCMV